MWNISIILIQLLIKSFNYMNFYAAIVKLWGRGGGESTANTFATGIKIHLPGCCFLKFPTGNAENKYT